MRRTRTMMVLQVVVTCLVAALGAIALIDGRFLVGVLLVALAGARVGMIVERRRRRAELARRFPGMAARGRR
jgi:Na+/H+-translocating membrane pyrophosphatase